MPKTTCLCCGLPYVECVCCPGLTQHQIGEAIKSWAGHSIRREGASERERRAYLNSLSWAYVAWFGDVSWEVMDRDQAQYVLDERNRYTRHYDIDHGTVFNDAVVIPGNI